ncbi:putative Zn-dependent peptidase [Gottschalkia purinilytica]|uniref:Putative Zn-dependent peptidase n=1 Tax=Gottschalkia purinilytica TaxID=1503 RepID=A0A0L0WEX6_GOTPU|nr:pitrilysin family protein [Gottschalkia purinilytica]KNF10024.1 putative Zn-dependent peptidase [Gottschalkia purinilytica]
MNKQYFDAKEHIFENGLKLITIKKDTKISSIQVGLKVGSINENLNEKGISHFIEHMLFKGTKHKNNEEINQALEDRGGSYNAYTTYTTTVFSITALAEELEKSTETLSDMIINSTFPKEEIEKERSVILSEIKNGMDDVEQYSYSKVNDIAFKKSFLKYDIAGTERRIKKFDRKQLLEFYNAYYIPNNCVISVISSYEHDEVKNMIERYFSNWERREIPKKDIIIEKNICTEKISYKKDIEQSTLIYLYTFYNLSREEEIALEILNYKLGESPNSILFRTLREEKGMTYEIYSELDATDNVKTLYIYTSLSEDDIWEAKRIIEDCIENIITNKINIDEKNIVLMKKVMKTGIASILEDTDSLCNYVLHQGLTDKKIDAFVDDLNILNHIERDKIYEVARKVFTEPTIHILLNK